jgi:hypothetical protein
VHNYGDPPPPPRDQTRALRVVIRIILFCIAGFAVGYAASLALGWR